MIVDPIGAGRFIIADQRVMDWVAERIEGIEAGYRWPNASAIGLATETDIIAGMVVHDYSRASRNCQVVFAASTPRWATKGAIRAMLAYPFRQLGCERLTTIIAASNARSIRFNEGLGFKLEGVMRRGCGDEDAMIYGLLREETPKWMGFT